MPGAVPYIGEERDGDMLDEDTRYIPVERPGGLDERFCEVMDAAPVMIWVSGADKNCVWFNRPWLNFTGRSMAEELGDGWTEGVHPDDYERCLDTYVNHFEARTEFRMQYRLRGHDGTFRWIDDRGIPRQARNGTFLGYIGSCVDISHLKETEAALREHETRLRLATSSAKLGIYEQDIKNDRTVWVNERMYEIFGRSAQDGSLSREVFYRDYLHPDDADAFQAARGKAIETGADLHIACRIRLKTGGERWVQIDGAFERIGTGEPLRVVGMVADITERKILEQRAAELSERLINVQEEERQRISQELHDSTTQHLVAAGLHVATLRPKSGLTPDDIRRWDETEACLEEAQKEIRTFSYLMHPPALEADKLVAGMEQFVSGFSERTGIQVQMRLDTRLNELPFQMQRTVLRITQEALGNVHRHAGDCRARVDGRIMADKVHLIIADNGRGLGTKNDANVGRGIRGMQDRTTRWQGQMRIRSGSKGTRVHAMWPVPHGLLHAM
jgi:PAS domain S-box-containing protein